MGRTSCEWVMDSSLIATHGVLDGLVRSKIDSVCRTFRALLANTLSGGFTRIPYLRRL